VAAEFSDVPTVRWLIRHKFAVNRNAARNAAARNDIPMLHDLMAYGIPLGYKPIWNIYEAAICNGHLPIIKWMIDNGMDWNSFIIDYNDGVQGKLYRNSKFIEMCQKAASIGSQDIILFMHQNGCKFDITVLNHALKNGHFELAQFLYDIIPGSQRNQYVTEQFAWTAGFFGNRDIIRQVAAKQSNLLHAIKGAAAAGRIDVIDEIVLHNASLDIVLHTVSEEAVNSTNAQTTDWLKKHNRTLENDTPFKFGSFE
jgi:hypothetical protein